MGRVENRAFRRTAKLLGLAFFVLLLILSGQELTLAENSISTSAESKIVGPFNIPINPPANFNFMTRAAVLNERIKRVKEHCELLKSASYVPDDEIFGAIVDGRPWWGLHGLGFYGSGENSIKGLSVHSSFILNPYILVGVRTSQCCFGKGDEVVALRRKFMCEPKLLKWWPKGSKLEVTYDMKSYVQDFKAVHMNYDAPYYFDLQAYNARDLGFKYIYIPIESCSNISYNYPSGRPVLIPQYFHCGGSCGYPGGCNNQSPASPPMDSFACKTLPARVTVYLYRNAPVTAAKAPDFICYINLI